MTNKMKLMSLFVTFSMIGCSLEVDNPNSLLEADLAEPSAASALADFKNSYTPASVAVVATEDLVLGQTSVHETGGVVTIDTCFAIGTGGTATDAVESCTLGEENSTMQNKVTIE